MKNMFEKFISNHTTKSLASCLKQMEEISHKAHVVSFSCVQTQNSWGLSDFKSLNSHFFPLPNLIFLLLLIYASFSC